MVDPKFAMNSLLLRRRFSAGKNASLVFEELAPFSSFQRDNFAACYHLKAIVSHLCLLVFFAGIRVSLRQPLEWKHCQDCKRMWKPPGRRWVGRRREEEGEQWREIRSTRLPPSEGLSRWSRPGKKFRNSSPAGNGPPSQGRHRCPDKHLLAKSQGLDPLTGRWTSNWGISY